MASSTTTSLLLPLHRLAATYRRTPALLLATRRHSLMLLLSSLLFLVPVPSRAADIPLFDFRSGRRIEKAEEAIIEEGEKELEKRVEAAEEGIGGALGLSVAGDLLVGVSVVNGILAPQGDKL